MRSYHDKLWDNTADRWDWLYFVALLLWIADQALCLGFNLIALFIATLTCITGPGASSPHPPPRAPRRARLVLSQAHHALTCRAAPQAWHCVARKAASSLR